MSKSSPGETSCSLVLPNQINQVSVSISISISNSIQIQILIPVLPIMVIVESCQLTLPNPSISSLPHYYFPPPHITSFLLDSNSSSLALYHSDTSYSLYPSLSPLSLSTFPSLSTLIPSPTSSGAFLHLHHFSNLNPNSVFLTSSPFLGGTAILLRFYIFNPTCRAFVKLKVGSNHRDLRFDEKKGGVVVAVSHGVSVKLVGGSNVFAMYSVSNSKIWVFAVKLVADFQEVKLMKCAVIDCVLPVFSMSVSFGHLILGEENGVRVFPLRPLVKGRVNKEGRVISRRNLNGGMDNKDFSKLEGKKINKVQNNLIQGINGIDHVVYSSNSGSKNVGPDGAVSVVSNGQFEGKIDKHSDSVKLRTMKLRQDTKDCGACFLPFNSKESGSLKSIKIPLKSPKAISINALSPNKCLVLDSDGYLHLMRLSNSVHGSEPSFHTKQLPQTMKVRKLAVLPGSQTIWTSDGQYTVHVILVTDEETSINETDAKETTQAIFASEKIQEIMSFSANAILILGQGNIFSYAIS